MRRGPRARTLALVATLAVAGSPHGASAAPAHAASAPVRLAIHIPRIHTLVLRDHPRFVSISAEDIARGHVLVTGPRIGIVSNDRRGVILRAGLLGSVVEAVELVGLGAPVVVAGDGTSIALGPAAGATRSLPVRYRMRLSTLASPGTYRWPVMLSIEDP